MNLLWYIFIQQRRLYLTYRCQYCQAFTPKYEKLATIHNFTGMVLGKIDGLAYKTVTEKYGVFSYPTIALFWK
jgi:thiol-disulfide isomerase/thioredoxin